MHTCPGGIGHDYLWPAMLIEEVLVKQFFHITAHKTGIIDAIDPGIFAGIPDGFGYRFNTGYVAGMPGQKICNGAGSRIQIINMLVSLQFSIFPYQLIQLISLMGVGLVKGFRANLETQLLHLFKNVIPPEMGHRLQVINGVIGFGIDHVDQGSYFRKLRLDMLQQGCSFFSMILRENNDHHHFSTGRGANDQVPEETLIGSYIKKAVVVLNGETPDLITNGIGGIGLKVAMFNVNNFIPPPGYM